MDTNPKKDQVLKSFTLGPLTVVVFENSKPEVAEHRYLVGIIASDENGRLKWMFDVCSSHARELGEVLERAAEYAERECESVAQ